MGVILIEQQVMLPDDVLDTIFNDQSIMELIPDEETIIKEEDLELISGDPQGFPDEGRGS